MFILINRWMIGKNSMKHHYSRLNMEDIADGNYAKNICKDFK